MGLSRNCGKRAGSAAGAGRAPPRARGVPRDDVGRRPDACRHRARDGGGGARGGAADRAARGAHAHSNLRLGRCCHRRPRPLQGPPPPTPRRTARRGRARSHHPPCDPQAEHLQRTGSFKLRGATNAVFSLDAPTAALGVVAHSSGNHAAAVACAASTRGIKATIVVPHTTAKSKIANTELHGGQTTRVVLCEPGTKNRQERAEAEAAAMGGAALVHPYNDAATIAGQGTIGLEMLEQVPDLDAILVPTSGGGMLAGVMTIPSDRTIP